MHVEYCSFLLAPSSNPLSSYFYELLLVPLPLPTERLHDHNNGRPPSFELPFNYKGVFFFFLEFRIYGPGERSPIITLITSFQRLADGGIKRKTRTQCGHGYMYRKNNLNPGLWGLGVGLVSC